MPAASELLNENSIVNHYNDDGKNILMFGVPFHLPADTKRVIPRLGHTLYHYILVTQHTNGSISSNTFFGLMHFAGIDDALID